MGARVEGRWEHRWRVGGSRFICYLYVWYLTVQEAVARLQNERELSTLPTTSNTDVSTTKEHGVTSSSIKSSSRSQKSQLALIAGSIMTKRKR